MNMLEEWAMKIGIFLFLVFLFLVPEVFIQPVEKTIKWFFQKTGLSDKLNYFRGK